jgi:hypothetical protein
MLKLLGIDLQSPGLFTRFDIAVLHFQGRVLFVSQGRFAMPRQILLIGLLLSFVLVLSAFAQTLSHTAATT